jgi:methylglyoxal synthase
VAFRHPAKIAETPLAVLRTPARPARSVVEQSRAATATVAFITTPKFRAEYPAIVDRFIRRELYRLSFACRVVCSGTTFDVIQNIIAKDFADLSAEARDDIANSMQVGTLRTDHYAAWQEQLAAGIETRMRGAQGVVEILFDLVEGRLTGVIHLAHADDLESKADSRVLWRAANVHDVPIAHEVNTAARFVSAWQRRAPEAREEAATAPASILDGLDAGKSVIALISHDGKKADMCAFVEKNADRIASYDVILTTATTGTKLIEALTALDPAWPVHKIKRCLSGPKGGDVQIACAVLRGLCQKVVFLQDPATSHPHEADIRLFEKVLLECSYPVELATNRSAADMIL